MPEKNYQIIRSAVPQTLCDLIADYVCLKKKTQHRSLKKDALANVHREYADPLMEVFSERIRPLVEKATGLQLWPTLSFSYAYGKNQKLDKHKDRISCELVAGLCFGADPLFTQTQGTWPLMLDHHGQDETINLAPGDLVIFKGHETTHWREPFQGDWFVSAIFAYVDQNGPFAYLKYDQRQRLGDKHVGMCRWTWGVLFNRLKKIFS